VVLRSFEGALGVASSAGPCENSARTQVAKNPGLILCLWRILIASESDLNPFPRFQKCLSGICTQARGVLSRLN
jgi:hypothetical protein